MSTGDIKNNLRKLQKEANLVHYPEELDYDGLTKGDPESHLLILYYAFLDYSDTIHQYLTKQGYGISGKRGIPFLATVFKIMREKNPVLRLTLRVDQFMLKGFAERKIMLTTGILTWVRMKLKELAHVLVKPKNQYKYGSTSKSQANECNSNIREMLVIPDMSCIKPDDDRGLETYNPEELPVKEMQSTAVSTVHPKLLMDNASLDTGGHIPTCVGAPHQYNNTSGPDSSCLRNAKSLHHVPVRRHVAVHALHGAQVQEYQCDVGIAVNNSHPNIIELKSCINSLELKNQQLSLQLDEQKSVNGDLQKCNKNLLERVSLLEAEITKYNELKDSIHGLEKLTLRVSELESVVKQFKVWFPDMDQIPDHSPICGSSLCERLNGMRLQSKNTEEMPSISCDNSLADITNESPLNPAHSRSEKLFELVRDTRNLLGMDVNTPKSNEENLSSKQS